MAKASPEPVVENNHQDDVAQTIIVPVSRPDTAFQMLNLAVSLIDPEKGQVIALIVSLGDSEKANRTTEEIQPLIDLFTEDGHNVELETEISTSVSRGILDAARERGADIIILGVQKSARHDVKLGTIVENVVQAAPCDVIIYRLCASPTYDRVVIPVDYSAYTQVALELAGQLCTNQDMPIKLYIRRDFVFPSRNEQQIVQTALANLPDDKVERVYTTGSDPADRILDEVIEDDLLILGFSQRSDFDRQIANDLSHKLMNRAVGPVIMVSRLSYKDNVAGHIQKWVQRSNPTLTEVERNEMVWQARKQAEPNLDYSMMILLSAGLASLGLLLNSPAVIIGAMLVAPLMQPLGAFSTGLTTALLGLSRRAALTLFQGVLLSLLVSIVMGALLPIDLPTSEMLSRGNPTLLDAAVALVSGLVAAYATARKGIPVALAGVAIAAALMPPLCTVGLGVAFRDVSLTLGSGLLFLANITFIIAAESLVFLWLGLRPGQREDAVTQTKIWWGVLAGVVVVVLAMLVSLSQRALDEADIENRLAEIFAPARVVSVDFHNGDTLDILLTLSSDNSVSALTVNTARQSLAESLDRQVSLEVIVLETFRAETPLDTRVKEYFGQTFPQAGLANLRTSQTDTIIEVSVTLRTQQTFTAEMVETIRADLTNWLQLPVSLSLIVEPVMRFEAKTTAEPSESGD